MTESLRMRDRVRLEQEPDHIGVWPDAGARAAGTASSASAGDQAPDDPAGGDQ